jgi:hypothetical protein
VAESDGLTTYVRLFSPNNYTHLFLRLGFRGCGGLLTTALIQHRARFLRWSK